MDLNDKQRIIQQAQKYVGRAHGYALGGRLALYLHGVLPEDSSSDITFLRPRGNADFPALDKLRDQLRNKGGLRDKEGLTVADLRDGLQVGQPGGDSIVLRFADAPLRYTPVSKTRNRLQITALEDLVWQKVTEATASGTATTERARHLADLSAMHSALGPKGVDTYLALSPNLVHLGDVRQQLDAVGAGQEITDAEFTAAGVGSEIGEIRRNLRELSFQLQWGLSNWKKETANRQISAGEVEGRAEGSYREAWQQAQDNAPARFRPGDRPGTVVAQKGPLHADVNEVSRHEMVPGLALRAAQASEEASRNQDGAESRLRELAQSSRVFLKDANKVGTLLPNQPPLSTDRGVAAKEVVWNRQTDFVRNALSANPNLVTAAFLRGPNNPERNQTSAASSMNVAGPSSSPSPNKRMRM